MKAIGIVLIVLSIAGFALGGLSFTRDEKVADVGPVEIEKQETESFPIRPLAAGAALIAGIALVVVGARRP